MFRLALFSICLWQFTLTSAAPGASVVGNCKCFAGSSCWPSTEEWSKLNDTVNSQLIKYTPLASVCYQGPEYNKELCDLVNAAWFASSELHEQDPGSVLSTVFANNSCLPTLDPKSGTCSIGGYPEYVLAATDAEQIGAAVKFTREKNIRLNVKGTGHDYLGRSTAPGSLSIWTRGLQQLEFHDSFQPKRCNKVKAGSAATVGTGHVFLTLYTEAAKRNMVVIGGADPSVGIGGFIQGGGHGPLTGVYGLAVQQLLEIQVVTPDGKLLTANECENSDLFWAMSGGGGSTFGVLTAVTVRTYPSPKVACTNFKFDFSPNDTELFGMLPPNFMLSFQNLSRRVSWATTLSIVPMNLLSRQYPPPYESKRN